MKTWKKIHIAAWLCLLGVIPAVIIGVIIDMGAEAAGTMLGLLMLSWFVLLVVSLIVRCNNPEAHRDLEKQKEWNELCKRMEEERKLKARQEKLRDNWPVSAVVISTQDKTKNKSGLGTAVIGGLVAGPLGAVVGASVGKKTVVTGQKVTFSVKYQSGRTGTETVDVGSERFKFLSSLLLK